MPKVAGRTKYPKGWEIIEPTLTELEMKMREAESDPQEGKRKEEAVWPIARINHERSRYIYEMFYKKKKISRELYNFCLKNGYADANLIAKWKKSGYERLCCLACIQRDGTNYGNTCICRVPRADLPKGKVVECINCGCHGCASGDT